jgi:hypothetical protein
MAAATAYMAASMVLKATAPRASPWLRVRRTGYSAMAMPALAAAAASSVSPPAVSRAAFAGIWVRWTVPVRRERSIALLATAVTIPAMSRPPAVTAARRSGVIMVSFPVVRLGRDVAPDQKVYAVHLGVRLGVRRTLVKVRYQAGGQAHRRS